MRRWIIFIYRWFKGPLCRKILEKSEHPLHIKAIKMIDAALMVEGKKRLDDETIALVLAELKSARLKFKDITDGHYGYAVIQEELDELWDAVKANDLEQAREEAIQVAAMGVRFFVDLVAMITPPK